MSGGVHQPALQEIACLNFVFPLNWDRLGSHKIDQKIAQNLNFGEDFARNHCKTQCLCIIFCMKNISQEHPFCLITRWNVEFIVRMPPMNSLEKESTHEMQYQLSKNTQTTKTGMEHDNIVMESI